MFVFDGNHHRREMELCGEFAPERKVGRVVLLYSMKGKLVVLFGCTVLLVRIQQLSLMLANMSSPFLM